MGKCRLAGLAPRSWPGGLVILLPPTVAQAHTGGSDTGLINGLMHPVFGLDHLLAMISVGVVSAQLGGHNIWRIPAAFVGAMTAGAALGILQTAMLHTELGIAVSVLALGIGIVFAHRHMSPWPITALVLFFGANHGYAHGLEIPRSASPALYTLGFVISTSVLHIVGVLIGEVTLHAAMALDGVALHGRRGDGFRRGVLAANARDGLTAKARSGDLRPALRIGLVAAGYGAAFLLASAAVAIRLANTSGPAAQASSGMYAFGDFFLFIAVFGLLALVPTVARVRALHPDAAADRA